MNIQINKFDLGSDSGTYLTTDISLRKPKCQDVRPDPIIEAIQNLIKTVNCPECGVLIKSNINRIYPTIEDYCFGFPMKDISYWTICVKCHNDVELLGYTQTYFSCFDSYRFIQDGHYAAPIDDDVKAAIRKIILK